MFSIVRYRFAPDLVATATIIFCWTLGHIALANAQPRVITHEYTQLAGGKGFSESAEARPGDYINFSIHLGNGGNAVGASPMITVTLDTRLTYVTGSSGTVHKIKNRLYTTRISDDMIGFKAHAMTWAFLPMPPRNEADLYLSFQTRLARATDFAPGKTTILCRAKSSFRATFAFTNYVKVIVTREVRPDVSFVLRTSARNVTVNGLWSNNFNGLLSACPGDVIEFHVSLLGAGNTTAKGIILKAILPDGMTLQGKATVSGPTRSGVVLPGDNIVTEGYTLPVFKSHDACIITFRAIVDARQSSGASLGRRILVNHIQQIQGGKVVTQADTSVLISASRGFILSMDVLDPKDNIFKPQVGNVRTGETLTFRVLMQNNTKTLYPDPTVRVSLPDQLTYTQNSLAQDSVAQHRGQEDLFGGGIIESSCEPGMAQYLTFQARINESASVQHVPPITAVTVVAYVSAHDRRQITDAAVLYVGSPPLTNNGRLSPHSLPLL